MPRLIKERSRSVDCLGTPGKAMDFTLARQGERGTRNASHKPTASTDVLLAFLAMTLVGSA